MLIPRPAARAGLTRRTAIGAAAAVAASGALVSGCTPKGVDRRPRRTPLGARATETPEVDADVALAATVLGDEQAMLDRIEATGRRHPRLTDVLADALAAHQAHVDLLTDAVPKSRRPDAGSAPPTDADSPSVSPSVPPSDAGTPAVPAHGPAALANLARHEDRLSLVGKRSAFAARSGAFARVLASMAASAAQHSTVLRDAAEDRR